MASPAGPSANVAVVGWAQTPMVRRTGLSETQLLLHVITDALEPLELTRADVDFTCLGSCDYITGQAFSFVSNLDAIGAWPPKRDSHVEMDGAWALYEAWLRLQEGDIEIAVVTGSGRSSTGDPARRLRDRPAFITGFDHRTECHNPVYRDLTDSPSTRIAARAAGLGDGPLEVAELQA